MAAVGFALLLLGALLVYAGLTGDSLVTAVQGVLQDKPKAAKP